MWHVYKLTYQASRPPHPVPTLIAMKGHPATGKSTLARLLCGLYPPDPGQVWVGETLVTEALRDAHQPGRKTSRRREGPAPPR